MGIFSKNDRSFILSSKTMKSYFQLKKCAKYYLVGQRCYYQRKRQSISDKKQRVELIKEKIDLIYLDSKSYTEVHKWQEN
jgi:hypothetical protein